MLPKNRVRWVREIWADRDEVAKTDIRIAWSLKNVDELVEAAKELDRPRVGRTARRDRLVETIADECRRIAESLASAPPVGRPEPDQ